jgi:hypothetical protein
MMEEKGLLHQKQPVEALPGIVDGSMPCALPGVLAQTPSPGMTRRDNSLGQTSLRL